MLTVAECLQRARRLQSVSDTARLDTELLLAHALDKTRTWLYTWPEYELTELQQQAFESLMRARADGEPVAYLTGMQEFWSLPLKVGRQTLIPRPETELLVEQVLALELPDGDVNLLDLGTGTGAIALALAREKPHWQITAADIIEEAVMLARDNARALGLSIEVLHSDWFTALPSHRRFQVIVSNPPYIDTADVHLGEGDVRFEPRSALVAADAGLAAIRRIVTDATGFLEADGWLLLEHGWQQAEAVQSLLTATGFDQVRSERDLGGHLRITLGRWRG